MNPPNQVQPITKTLIQRRTLIFVVDFLLLLAGLGAFQRTTIRADIPADVALQDGRLLVNHLDKFSKEGLALGDEVLSIDGQSPKTPREMEFLINGMSIGSFAAVQVDRGGSHMDLRVPLIRFHSLRYLMVQCMVGLLFMTIGWLLFYKRPDDLSAAILHMCFILVGLMVMTTPTRYSLENMVFSRIIDVFSAVACGFSPALLLHFSLVFPRQRFSNEMVSLWMRWIYGTALVLTAWFAAVTAGVGNPATIEDFHRYAVAYSVSRWFLCGCVIAAVGFLVRSGFNSSGDAERRQMRWILLGLTTGPFIWAATWQIPILMGYNALVSEEASLAILATVPVVFAIAIIQYRFMDVDFVMHSGMVVVLGGGVAMASWAINSSVLASVTAALLVAMLFEGQERERLNRMKSFFVSGVSHDLKTPLTGIKMYTQMLKAAKPGDRKRQQRFLNIIDGEADRLTRLIDNVLSFSRLERGKREYKFVPSNLNLLVKDTLSSMGYPIQIGGFTLKKRFSRKKLLFEADRDAVNEAVGNLITNAVKFSGNRKDLLIQTLRMHDYVGVRVQDWGIGIPTSEQGSIFEPFFRSPQEKAKSVGGVGLGLALVKNIVDAHGGYVDVMTAPGQGSIFTLWFPGKDEG